MGDPDLATSDLPAATTVSVTVRRPFRARLSQPRSAGPGTCPVVAFGHGFTQHPRRYDSILTRLAARGYVVIAPDSQTGLLPSHRRLAESLWDAIVWSRAHVTAAHRTLAAFAGHSMGGGAAILAAARHPEVGAVATLAAAQTRPSAAKAMTGLRVPALFIVGAEDRIVPPDRTRPLYAATPAPATWVSIAGGYHCGFVDSTSFGGLGCDHGSIPRDTQLALVAGLLGDWLDETLHGAAVHPAPTGVVVERRC
ncbi:dienelactone hydrolase family protein [Intrasporangium sp.]|uniref:dienelactone hydrolase family protein n=1 Tax=Intrasporangium sp. TaxID=1925024 RepID=UPI00293B36E4|nr:alpha/beta hydrolase [Intrasporangium sp.]MDV3221813.1 alpha/beta hydrolase [Intrasporangium sp.]